MPLVTSMIMLLGERESGIRIHDWSYQLRPCVEVLMQVDRFCGDDPDLTLRRGRLGELRDNSHWKLISLHIE